MTSREAVSREAIRMTPLDVLRSAWWEDLAKGVLKHFLHPGTRQTPTGEWARSPGALPRALIVLQIAVAEVGSKSNQQIVAHLRNSAHPELQDNGLAESLVQEVLTALRHHPAVHTLPMELAALREGLISWWCALRAQQIGSAATALEVQRRWSVGEDAEVLAELTSLPTNAFVGFSHVGRSQSTGSRHAEYMYAHLYHQDRVKELTLRTLAEHSSVLPVEAHDPPHLIEFLAELNAFRAAEGSFSKQAEGLRTAIGTEATEALEQVILGKRHALVEVLEKLTAFEVSLLQGRPGADTGFQDECLDNYLRIHTMETAFPASVPQVGARLRDDPPPGTALAGLVPAPAWMARRLISEGFWSFHTRLGALPWWYATVEDEYAVEAVRRIHDGAAYGLRLLPTTGNLCTIELLLPSDSSGLGAVSVMYTYSLSDIDGACELLLLARAHVVRVDFLRQGAGDSTPRVLTTVSIHIKEELADAVAESATDALRVLTGGDPATVLPGLWPADTEVQAAVAFTAAEYAKAEDLDDALGRLTVDIVPTAEARAAWNAVQRAATALARARRTAVEDYLVDGRAGAKRDQAVRQAEETLRVRQSVLRAKRRPERAAARSGAATPSGILGSRLEVLGGDDRAMAHVILDEPSRPCVAWARTDGGSTRTGLIRLPHLELQALHRSIREWVSPSDGVSAYSPRRAEDLRRWSAEIAGPLHDALDAEGVRHLVLSPTWLLDLLPLHAAPVSSDSDAPLLLDCFESVTYAPTAQVLGKLARLPAPLPDGRVLLVSYGADLSGGQLEARTIDRLHGGVTVLTDGHATPSAVLRHARHASVVHIASHCVNESNRFASGLALSPADGGSGRLTVAHLMEQGHFQGVELVVLASCGSGAYPQTELALQHYRAVDAALLAGGARATLSTLWPVSDLVASVFMTLLHSGIATGEQVTAAHRRAVDYIRFARWRSASPDDVAWKAERVLDAEQVTWREDLDLHPGVGSRPASYHWAGYRLSGLVW
ncbi:CHAT domain-containing protein [Streptacidiphilus sp. N1-10]|uniref:CHAT domain-containing protein n=1 Tax=Streptacidiphilus jeojiensis TaxID=3229225 RepID=A0ABV6XFC6_9ACTN